MQRETSLFGHGRPWSFCVVTALLLVVFYSDSLLSGKPLSAADLLLTRPAFALGDFEPRHRLMTDPVFAFEPWRALGFEALRQGRVPRLNQNIYAGVPYAANFQTAAFYPLRIIPASVSPRLNALGHALELLLAGFGVYLLAGYRGLDETSRWLGGLAWTFSGGLVVWKLWPTSAAFGVLPWVLLGLELLLRDQRRMGLSMSAAAVAFSWLAGHPQTTVDILLLTGAYGLYRVVSRRDRAGANWTGLGRWVGAALLGTGLVAFFLLPAFHYLVASHAWQRRVVEAATNSGLSLPSLPGFFFPFIWGSRLAGGLPLDRVVGAHHTNILAGGYVSFLLPLLFVPLAYGRRREIEFWFWFGCFLLCLCLALGLPPFTSVYRAIPIVGAAKPVRLILFAGFAVLLLSMHALHSLRLRPLRGRERQRAVAALAIVGLCALAGAATFRLARPLVRDQIESRLPAWSDRLAESQTLAGVTAEDLLRRLEGTTVRYPFWIGVVALLAIGALGAAEGGGPVRLEEGYRWGPLIALVILDLFVFGRGYTPAIDPARHYPASPAIRFLQQNAGPYRVAAAGDAMPPNVFSMYGLADIRGMDALEPREYMELAITVFGMEDAQPVNFKFYEHPDYTHPVADLLGLKYLLTDRPLELLVGEEAHSRRFELVFQDGPEVFIYENQDALPGFYLARRVTIEGEAEARLSRLRRWETSELEAVVEVGEPHALSPSSSVRRVHLDDRTLRFAGEFESDGFLVVAAPYLAGWECFIDGLRQPVLRTNHAFLGVDVPAGAREIVFNYRTTWLGVGIQLSLFSSAVLVWLVTGRRRRASALDAGDFRRHG